MFSSTETTTQPFRGYFSSETAPNVGNRLLVASYIDVSAIVNGIQEVVNEPVVAQPQRIVTGVYSITGTKIQSSTGSSVKEVLQSLPAGIYIINGRKYIK